jgi:hypothetical protein
MADPDDPMAAILARYERFEDHPLNRLQNAVRAGGMRATPTTMSHAGVVNEIAQDGFCVGYISRQAAGGYVLELSRKEVSPEAIAQVAGRIEISERNARSMATQKSHSQLRSVG